MDVDKLAIDLLLKGMTQEQQTAALKSIKDSVTQAKAVQKQRIGENVQVVVQALKKIESDLRGEYSDVADKLAQRIASIKDGQDGRDGLNGKNGKDGRPGRDGAKGEKGDRGLDGRNGVDGVDGVSVSNAYIDFDGSLIISLSSGQVLNVGEVVSQDLAEKIQVISTMSTNGAVGISDEGTSISTGVKNINFVGAAVTASASGDDVTVNVSSGTGTVTSVAVSGGTTGLTTSGGPITTTGTITLGGTLAVASGGTGTATPSLVAGTNITSITGTWPNQTINASGTVTSVAATGGTGISVSGSPITTSGTLTITNTAPDQTVSLTASTGISTSGTYPNFTITNSAPDQTVSLTAGTGISTSGTYPNFTITNSAPDQTVSLTGAGTTAVTGTYPNFTVTSNDQFVGTVTSVGGTGTVNGISLSGTVTSSGNLTLGGTLSGVSLTTQVTGTLPIANGGTGVGTSTGTGSVVLSASPTLTGTPTAPTAASGTNTTQVATTAFVSAITGTSSSMGFRNRIINGAMVIDQRNAGASVTPSNGAYTLDRWAAFTNGAGAYTVQQSSTAPAGFTNSLLCTVTTIDSSVTGTDYYMLQHKVEGFNSAGLDWGSASAASVTLSFWVRSSITGTYSVKLGNGASDRFYIATYTINAANTFEYKTITIAGDTTGTWVTNNGTGIEMRFGLAIGSSFTSSTIGAWAAGNSFGATTASNNWIGTNGATFYITGVQLEAGTVASPFERRDYGRELMMCQRYAQPCGQGGTGRASSSTGLETTTQFRVPMRATPTISFGGFSGAQTEISQFGIGSVTVSAVSNSGFASATGSYLSYTTTGATTGSFCACIKGDTSFASAEL